MENIRTLGKVSAKFILNLYEEGKTVFVIKDAQRVLGKGYNETTDFLSRLVKRKIISRLKAGKFLIIPQELGSVGEYIGNWYVAAGEVVNSVDYYIAFYSAMHYWGMLTQNLTKIFVVTSSRQVVPAQMKDKLIFVFMNNKNIWGVSREWVTRTDKVRISDLEKTIIDSLAYPRYCGGITEVSKGIWMVKEKIDYAKLGKYIRQYKSNVVAKRLGYILETLEIKKPVLTENLKKYIKDRYDLLDPVLPRANIDKNNWHLIDNVGKKQIEDLIKY